MAVASGKTAMLTAAMRILDMALRGTPMQET